MWQSVRKNLAYLDDVIARLDNFITAPVGAGIHQGIAIVGSATPSADDKFAVRKSRA